MTRVWMKCFKCNDFKWYYLYKYYVWLVSAVLQIFADVISNLAVSLDKAFIVLKFNIHFDNPKDLLRTAFVSIQDSVHNMAYW